MRLRAAMVTMVVLLLPGVAWAQSTTSSTAATTSTTTSSTTSSTSTTAPVLPVQPPGEESDPIVERGCGFVRYESGLVVSVTSDPDCESPTTTVPAVQSRLSLTG
jgi:hypothetical protein